ncbi:MAG: 3-oxoacyl-[acyl-carrier-protein] reductase [Planctomycetota bacterium]
MVLKGQVALVTGGARGIGRCVAERLAEWGANVAVLDVLSDEAEATAKAVAEAFSVETLAFKADVTNLADIEKIVETVQAKWGRVDILVNNAGITRDNLLIRMSDEEWDKVLAVNLKGAFLCLKAVARPMMKQRRGRIVNVASIVGVIGNAGQANYSASKAGLIGLTRTAAKELASRNITVNAVAPGFIDTVMTKNLPEDVKKAMLANVPLGRLGAPDDVARAVRFLAGPDADYVTGHVLHVTGGLGM